MQRVRLIIIFCILLLALVGVMIFFLVRKRTPTAQDVQRSLPSQGVKETRQQPVSTVWDRGPANDRDADGVSDAEEARLGTNPLDKDTDHDGSVDGEELLNKTDPKDPTSFQTQDSFFSIPRS